MSSFFDRQRGIRNSLLILYGCFWIITSISREIDGHQFLHSYKHQDEEGAVFFHRLNTELLAEECAATDSGKEWRRLEPFSAIVPSKLKSSVFDDR